MMPSCDQIGVPIHFHSSTTSGSACLMSLRILPRVSPRQSPSSSILFEMSSDADWPRLAPDFFTLSSDMGGTRRHLELDDDLLARIDVDRVDEADVALAEGHEEGARADA